MRKLFIAVVVTVASAAAVRAQTAAPTETVVVTARRDLMGSAVTSSQGVVVNSELALTPAFRPGQLLETVPGLVVTSHSGEGKANEYLLRGFDLDHGTDLAVSVDGMPVNERTHAHGQGYTDLNFMIPELATNIQFTKGPYFAAKGDFASVGSVDINYLDNAQDRVSATGGMFGFGRVVGIASGDLGPGTVLGALELQHYDGPWTHGDDQRKINAVLRYGQGDAADGYSVTAMVYRGLWNATTDQPERAIAHGLIGRFGTLDPSDGGQAQRLSLSGQYRRDLGSGHLEVNLYAVNNRLTLWNDFTHFLDDPVNGDQEAQNEARATVGGGASYSYSGNFYGFETELVGGVQGRFDDVHVDRLATKQRRPISITEDDRVQESSVAGYVQATTHWTGWLRSVIGLRQDYFAATDHGTNAGDASANLFQPKGSLILDPWDGTEVYVSAGRGFHSDDARGVIQGGAQGASLIAASTGDEIGVREQFLPNLTATLTLFQIHFQSELTYDPDVGQTSAGPPSRRTGVELNTTWQATDWLEVYGTIAASHARYTEESDDGTGHIGRYIPNAPAAIASLAFYMKNLGRWSGGLEYRFLGAFPLTPDNAVRGEGYDEWNGEVGYGMSDDWKLELGVFNILNTHANAAEFWYTDRLPGEPAGGIDDIHIHPLEPLSFRLTVTRSF